MLVKMRFGWNLPFCMPREYCILHLSLFKVLFSRSMSQPRIQSPLLWVLAILMATLPLLAWMQWRWIDDITKREAERLQASVRTSASYAAWSVNQRLLALQQTFHLASFEKLKDYEEELTTMYQDWRQNPDSSLLSGVFLVRANTDPFDITDMSDVYRFNEATAQLELTDDTTAMTIAETLDGKPPFPRMATHLQALIIPLLPQAIGQYRLMFDSTFPNSLRSKGGKMEMLPPFSDEMLLKVGKNFVPPDVLILVLNSNIMKKHLLPKLMKANFQKTGYGWAVIERTDSTILCAFDETMSFSAFTEPDFALPIGFVPPRTPNKLGKTLTSILARLPLTIVAEQDSLQGKSTVSKQSLHGTMRNMGLDSAVADILLGTVELRVIVAAGSIHDEVTGFQRRNLAVSFGVLLILAVGLIVVFLTVLRSERLAFQQMRFVAGVSHELRTPIAVLQSASENLADGIVKTPEQTQKYGQVMKREIARLMDMTEQTLSFAGIQSGKRTLDLQPSSIHALLEECLRRNADSLKGEGFEVALEIEQNLPTVLADSRAFGSMLDNLLTNAVKYSTDKREIRIKAAQRDTKIVVSIQDFGRGIAAKEQKRIFEPFYRTDDAINAQIHGNGLGLSIVQYFAKQHGGYVSVESDIGRGAIFTIHIPIRQERPPLHPNQRFSFTQ